MEVASGDKSVRRRRKASQGERKGKEWKETRERGNEKIEGKQNKR